MARMTEQELADFKHDLPDPMRAVGRKVGLINSLPPEVEGYLFYTNIESTDSDGVKWTADTLRAKIAKSTDLPEEEILVNAFNPPNPEHGIEVAWAVYLREAHYEKLVDFAVEVVGDFFKASLMKAAVEEILDRIDKKMTPTPLPVLVPRSGIAEC